MVEAKVAIEREEFIRRAEAEGWEVTPAKLNEVDFPNLVTLTAGSAAAISEVIRIEPPSDSRVIIWEGARFWAYFGGTTEVASITSRVALTLQKVNSVEDPIDSGTYDNFKLLNEEQIYRFQRGVDVTAGNRLRIKLNAAIATTTANTRFGLDVLILQRKYRMTK